MHVRPRTKAIAKSVIPWPVVPNRQFSRLFTSSSTYLASYVPITYFPARVLTKQPYFVGCHRIRPIPAPTLWCRFLSNPSTSYAMERNGEARNKRKSSPVLTHERPTKHLKPGVSTLINGDDTPRELEQYGVESEDEETRLLPLTAATADSVEWQATIEKVVRNVVSIHFCQTCSFDTDPACSSEATGFVVDAEKGYILTNRHVVCAGPFWGYCIFDNHEEVCWQRPTT